LTTSFELLASTAAIAVSSVVLAVILGVPFGSWLRTQKPQFERLISVLVLVPFLLPPLIVGMAFADLGLVNEVNSKTGILLILIAHTFMNFGFIARSVANSPITNEQIESAQLEGAPDLKIRFWVELPQLRPQLAAASLLVALYSATSYGLIRVLGNGFVETLETEMASAALVRLDLDMAWQLASLQTLLTLLLFFMSRQLGSAPANLDESVHSKLRVTPVEKVIALGALAATSVILLAILSGALEGPGLLANVRNLASTGERALLNISVAHAALNSLRNAGIVVAIALPVAYLVARRHRASGWVLLPIGISPVVVGLATLALSGYLPRELTASWVLLPLVQVTFALPVAYQILRPALRSLDRGILDAAKLDGASNLQRIFSVELPQVRRSFGLAVAFAAMVSIGEFGAASFLAFGENETLPIVLFKLLSRPGEENLGMAMTASALYILLAACVIWFSIRANRTSDLLR
jgi:thiamine transport system permease protein